MKKEKSARRTRKRTLSAKFLAGKSPEQNIKDVYLTSSS